MYRTVERESGSLRVLVDPSEARVYVDGYYAGTVDDFDGLLQRLNVAPARHEIALKHEGYKTHRVKVYVTPDATTKLQYDLEKGQGETFEDLAKGARHRRRAHLPRRRHPSPNGYNSARWPHDDHGLPRRHLRLSQSRRR